MSNVTESPPLSPSWTHSLPESRVSASSSGFPFREPEPTIARPGSNGSASHPGGHQRFVLADPVAFSYLEEDRDTTVLERSRKLVGYQCYIVEQWICSRTHPTFVIVTYTGEQSHSIRVGVISVPADESSWSPRLKLYFKSLGEHNARRKETPLGTVMLTSLSSFPTSLTLVVVPEGDVRKNRECFLVNENLKRLGCSGRVGLTLADPTPPTQAKFHHLYKTSDKVPFMSSVIELVKLCQTALAFFNCLEIDYVDGLLCDFTEKAVKDWWMRIGSDMYNVEAVDGILGPTSVSAILGTLIGARNRLHVLGAPVSKDVFDVDATKSAIGHFQKSQRMPKTRRLDASTLDRLHRVTAKQASSEGWAVPKAVKSTVADLSGKGGEMVMDIVGRRDKHNISEIETIDIERFAELVKGERTKWLWHGKARRRTNDSSRDGTLTHARTRSERVGHPNGDLGKDIALEPVKEVIDARDQDLRPIESRQGLDSNARETMFRRAKGRLIGAVGLKGHQYGHSKDSNFLYVPDDRSGGESSDNEDQQSPAATPQIPLVSAKDQATKNKPVLSLQPSPSFTKLLTETPVDSRLGSRLSVGSQDRPLQPLDPQDRSSQPLGQMAKSSQEDPSPQEPTNMKTLAANVSESLKKGHKFDRQIQSRPAQVAGPLLRHTQSFSHFETKVMERRNNSRWPRHLSFSAAEGTILNFGQSLGGLEDSLQHKAPSTRVDMIREAVRVEEAKQLRERIAQLDFCIGEWVEAKIAEVQCLDEDAAQQVTQLDDLYGPRRDEFHALEEGSEEIISREKQLLQEAIKDIETLGAKLEYDISTLKGKVEEVEDAVDEFQKQVEYTESRVQELTSISSQESWSSWLSRLSFGIRK